MSSSSPSPLANHLELEIREAGNRLLVPPSSVQELLELLDRLEHLLYMVGQIPANSMRDALKPSIEAVIADELVGHRDMDVKISVASCISEILRITAPNAPYTDQQLKEFFRMVVMAFEKLSSESAPCYSKITSVLKTFWNIRLCVVMLDLELDALILDMFRHFLSTDVSKHMDVMMDMERVMTLVIEESEQFPFELLSLLITSVRRENQKFSPLSWKLGEKVLKNCTTKLKPYLPEAMRRMGTDLHDYGEIVAFICHDAAEPATLGAKQPTQDAVCSGGVALSVNEAPNLPGTARMSKNDSLESLKHCDQAFVGEDSDPNVYTPVSEQKGLDSDCSIKKRNRKPNSLFKEAEGYDHTGKVLKHAWKNHEMETLSFSDETQFKRCRRKDKGSKVNHCSSLKLLSDSLGDLGTQAEERSTQHTITLMEKSERKGISKRKGFQGAGHSIVSTNLDDLCEVKIQELCSLEDDVKKQARVGKEFSREHTKESEVCCDKHVSDSATKLNCKMNCSSLKEEASKMAFTVKENGEDLVGRMIKVWWPLDEMFYEGNIVSYDYSTKRHKVLYTDGDVEILRLDKQRWEFVTDVCTSPDSGQGLTPVAIAFADTVHIDLPDSSASPRKRHKVTDKDSTDMVMPSSERKEKHVRIKLKQLERPKSIDPPIRDSSSKKRHAKHSPSLIKGEKAFTATPPIEDASCSRTQRAEACREVVDVRGYKVKPSTALTLEAILAKHGDIAANCLYKTASVRASLLEVICEVVQRLQNSDADVIISDIEAIESAVSDVETAEIEVSWLRAYLETFHRLKETRLRSCSLMDVKMNTILASRAARKDLEERLVELLEAQQRVKEAESRVKALELVERRIGCNVSEAEVEERSCRDRLQGKLL